MKKIILLTCVVLTTILFSCSNDDNGPKQLDITRQNISGKWYIIKGEKPDGSMVIYNGMHDTERDYVEILGYGKIITNIFYPDGVPHDNFGCSEFVLYVETKRIALCNDSFNGIISDLTIDTLRIDYDEPEYIGGGVGTAKAIIFSRQ